MENLTDNKQFSDKIENQNSTKVSNAVENNKISDFYVPAAIMIAGIFIAVAVYFSGNNKAGDNNQLAQNKPAGRQPKAVIDVKKDDLLQGGIILGNPDASLIIAEFADFQCPFCGKFANETKQKIIDTYVKTGKALFVYHDFAFLGEESGYAGEAGRCANEQGKFWEYHDFIYKHLWDTYYSKGKNGENVGALAKDNLKKFAVQLGLNANAFNQCVDSEKYKTAIEESTGKGRAFGIDGTPGFVIGGEVFTGALPFAEFQRIIEAKL